MGKPCSLDLRERNVVCAKLMLVRIRRRRLTAHRKSGSIAPKAQGRPAGTVGKLAAHMGFLIEVVTSDPDITLRELAGALEEAEGVRAQLSSIHRALARAGYSYKKRVGGQRA